MEKTCPKPHCLLVGGSTDKQTYLSAALGDHVNVTVESPDSCVDTARSLGATFAVVFWSRETDQLAHRLTRSIPGLQVLVETNPLALQGQVERNGFASVFNHRQNLDGVANDIKKLCRSKIPTQPSTSERFPDLAAGFLRSLPTLQASITEEQKLCDHLLNSLAQATQASKGVLFYSRKSETAYSVFSRVRCGSVAKGQTIPLDSEIVSRLHEIGSVIHIDDTDIPTMVRNHLRQFDCNLLVPVASELSLTAWIMLKLNRSADQLDYTTLQTIAYLASESFRIGRVLQARILRESFLEAGLNHARDAIMLVNEMGTIEFVSNKMAFFKFKNGKANSYRSLACGRLKSAIRQCLQGRENFAAWPFESNPEFTVTVQNLKTKGLIVTIRNENAKGDMVQINGNVWREAFSPENFDFWKQALGSYAKESSRGVAPVILMGAPQDLSVSTPGRLLEDLFPKVTRFRHVSVLLVDGVSKIRLMNDQFGALESFLEALLPQKFKSVQIICRQLEGTKVSIEICCEESPANAHQPAPIESSLAQQGAMTIGILSLISAGAELKKEIASLGLRWIVELLLDPLQFKAGKLQQS